MNSRENAAVLRAYLDHVASRLHTGARCQSLTRFAAAFAGVPLAAGLALSLTQCSDDTPAEEAGPEICDNRRDDDGDGMLDCWDAECGEATWCVGQPAYGIPAPGYEGDCTNAADEDGDGAVDCADSDCSTSPVCAAGSGGAGSGGAPGTGAVGTLYGIPLGGSGGAPAEDCANGADDDGDGDIDCGDIDCTNTGRCGVAAYGMFLEICDNGVDDDGNGQVDCADAYCVNTGACGVAEYGIFMELDCADRADDDGDGDIDCQDSDCADAAPCIGQPVYGIPAAETLCDDGADNDQDGAVDCDDPDCSCY